MPRAFDVTCAKNSIKLESGKGEFAHTVSNRLKRPVRARATVVPEGQTKREWLTVVEPTERDFAADGTQQFTVKVSTPAGTAPRSYTLKLLVSSVSNPDEEFADGPSVSFEVTPPPPPAPKGFPWWIVAIVGGVIVIGIVGAVLYFKLRGLGLRDDCDPADKKCPETMQCAISMAAAADGGTGRKTVCLLRMGVDCDANDKCASNRCDEKHKCGPGLHEPCDGTDRKCPEKMECAARVLGLPDGGTAPASVCLFKEGGNCDSLVDCATNRCDGNKCVEPVTGVACNSNSDCPSSKQQCTEHPTTGTKVCLLNPGMPCTNPADCASFWCSVTRKTCTAIDGRCEDNSDCNALLKFFCDPNGGPGHCKKPNGAPCREGHDQECSGGACDNGVCHLMACPAGCPQGLVCTRGVCTKFNPRFIQIIDPSIHVIHKIGR